MCGAKVWKTSLRQSAMRKPLFRHLDVHYLAQTGEITTASHKVNVYHNKSCVNISNLIVLTGSKAAKALFNDNSIVIK